MRAQVLDRTAAKEIDRAIAALERCIEAAERRMKEKIEADPIWSAKLGVLTSVEGVGFVTATVLLAKMPELGLLNRAQCAALAGLAPYDNESGTFTGQRSICGGRSEVRRALYMAAVSAARHNAVLRGFYERLIQAKKPFKSRSPP